MLGVWCCCAGEPALGDLAREEQEEEGEEEEEVEGDEESASGCKLPAEPTVMPGGYMTGMPPEYQHFSSMGR